MCGLRYCVSQTDSFVSVFASLGVFSCARVSCGVRGGGGG